MKNCVYCIEETPDRALVCRSCTRPVLLGVSSLAKLGTWAAIGRHTDNSFAIWNMVSGGDAVEHFEGTDKGWIKAGNRFDRLHRSGAGTLLGFIGGLALGAALDDS
jgi:hypothetical protein